MVKLIARRNCKFPWEGQTYRFTEGETKEVDIPIEQVDTNSFDIVGEKKKEKKKIEITDDEEKKDGE